MVAESTRMQHKVITFFAYGWCESVATNTSNTSRLAFIMKGRNMENDERIVKGIWIPIEVWKDDNLSWNEKILLMEIDSYTSENKDCFFSNEYIAKLLDVSETYANKLLSSLIGKGYVSKTRFDGRKRYIKSNICFRKISPYSANQPCTFVQPCLAAECNPQLYNKDCNNISLINKINKEEKEIDKSISKKTDDLFEKCWIAYKRKGVKKTSKAQWNKLKEDEKEKVLPHILAYVSTRDIQFQKDFQRYLRDKLFQDVVFDKNCVVYDPMMETKYTPNAQNIVCSDEYECPLFVGGYYGGSIADGYNDSMRPDGARLMLNNGQGFIRWNKVANKWEKESKY